MFSSQSNSLDALLHRPKPTAFQKFLQRPCIFLARKLYNWQQAQPIQSSCPSVTIVCISDTHNSQPKIPQGDVLIHADGLTQSGTLKELEATLAWLRGQPHPAKIVIAENHDILLDPQRDDPQGQAAKDRQSLDWGDIIYLENSETTITCRNERRLRVYGSPYSPRHGSWPFQYPRSVNVWKDSLPDAIDILVTHGPPRAHLDLMNLGCVHLMQELWRVRPRSHVFGHVHEGAGIESLYFNKLQMAYEQTVISGGGILNLLRPVFAFIQGSFFPQQRAKCVLVNAAMVSGLREDEIRHAIQVII